MRREKPCIIVIYTVYRNTFEKGIFLTCKKKCKTCLETCLEPVKNEFCIPPTMIMFPCRVCVSPLCVKPVVYMKQGPRSGIFSVYI